MRLFVLMTFIAAIPGAYYMAQLPYSAAIYFFIMLAILAYLGHVRKLSLVSYLAFFGFIFLSAIMGGYRADVKGVEGTILPEIVIGGIGILLILFKEVKASARR